MTLFDKAHFTLMLACIVALLVTISIQLDELYVVMRLAAFAPMRRPSPSPLDASQDTEASERPA